MGSNCILGLTAPQEKTKTLTHTDTRNTYIHRTDMWVGALLVHWAMLKGVPPTPSLLVVMMVIAAD